MISAGQDAPRDPEKRIERASLEKEAAGLRKVSAAEIQRLVKFSIEDDFLCARTSLVKTDEEVRVSIEGLRGLTRLRTFGKDGDETQDNFNLIHDEVNESELTQVITHIAASGGRLIIARDSESDRIVSSVQLIQDPPGFDPTGEEPPVRMLVRVTNQLSGATEVDLKLSGASFSELRRKYPRELATYLRPVLRDFRQEQVVFGSDQRAQWQVLWQDLPVDSAAAEKVHQIIAKFNSENYQEREQAMADLQSMGESAALVLARADRSKLSAEQNSGIDTFLAPYSPLAARDVARLRNSADYLLDCLYSEDEMLRNLAVARLTKVTKHEIDLGDATTPELRAAAIERLRQQLSTTTAPTQP